MLKHELWVISYQFLANRAFLRVKFPPGSCCGLLINNILDAKQGQTGCCLFVTMRKMTVISQQHSDHVNVRANRGEEPLGS